MCGAGDSFLSDEVRQGLSKIRQVVLAAFDKAALGDTAMAEEGDTATDYLGPFDPEVERVKDALADWWFDTARDEMDACIPKAVEYGSTDLAVIGRAQGRLMGRVDLSHEEATELGIFFYLQGKLARWEDAIVHGRRVSDDTLHDASVYIKMQQRNRAVGGWPFAPDDTEEM